MNIIKKYTGNIIRLIVGKISGKTNEVVGKTNKAAKVFMESNGCFLHVDRTPGIALQPKYKAVIVGLSSIYLDTDAAMFEKKLPFLNRFTTKQVV